MICNNYDHLFHFKLGCSVTAKEVNLLSLHLVLCDATKCPLYIGDPKTRSAFSLRFDQLNHAVRGR